MANEVKRHGMHRETSWVSEVQSNLDGHSGRKTRTGRAVPITQIPRVASMPHANIHNRVYTTQNRDSYNSRTRIVMFRWRSSNSILFALWASLAGTYNCGQPHKLWYSLSNPLILRWRIVQHGCSQIATRGCEQKRISTYFQLCCPFISSGWWGKKEVSAMYF